ncbi:hypothetical protein [uncultured Psychroserpens sp.]|uniref:hypothetical protein n=1 Tax=uncultured Psychroserpens sp. TaxID=255436 RepID=UPI002618E6D9|nr:hypothetical protein [uncultured Psychroserpens sp.]
MSTKSKYYEAYAAVMKITLRDGDASEEEKSFLQVFGKKIGITSSEYFDISENYMSHKIVAPYTYEERMEALYKIVEIIYSEKTMMKSTRITWLERMAIAIGFDPSYAKDIITKSLELFRECCDLEFYKTEIKKIGE